MLDYYKIFGIPRGSDYPVIKSAYKRLAIKYHPDKNPGNKAAEEFFKVINEAHQLLSKPDQKAQYDLLLEYYYQKYSATYQRTSSKHYKRPTPKTERSIYDRYGKYSWKNTPKYNTAPSYRVDRNYFKVQFLTLGLVALVSIFVIAISWYNQHLHDLKVSEIKAKNEKTLSEAQLLYDKGQYRVALTTIEELIRENPIDPQFYHEKEDMVASLFNLTTQLYRQADYSRAIKNLEVLRDYQSPMRLATWKMMADCNLQLNNYSKAIHALEYILIRDKRNIELIISIGDIYHTKLNRSKKALAYYNKAKYLFKEFQSASYGEAFELIMPVEKTPEIYYELFNKRAEANKAIGNYEEAITDYNWAIFLHPKRGQSYLLRGDCYRKQGNIEKACKDFKRSEELGNNSVQSLRHKYCI
ncbi:DnaJ domain-containing protein [Fulvivirga sp. 29W222]|uniref:DnaJ domain-containing protein n=1 Tax=Fulvivirga marina TaxID=2494733 RepID=A0A937FV65_9BACT|nr:DnaJ domain-containing protein [Fulvivirga marina]MBL6445043.1 DnaJ domain-containing protein [Fulvivirga marina]